MGGKGGAADGMKTDSALAESIASEWALVKSDGAGSPTWLWAVLDSDSGVYEILASGDGGLEAMASASEPQKIQFGGVRVNVGPNKQGRFVQVLYCGPEVSAVKVSLYFIYGCYACDFLGLLFTRD